MEIDETTEATGGSESLDTERACLLRQLEKRPSKQIQSNLQRNHHNIASQIRTFIRNLGTAMPLLAAHLGTSLKMDFPHFLYSPNPRITWKF